MAHNMFSSMNLRNTAPTYDEDDPVEDGFATALEENYKLTIGNSYGEGDDGTGNIIFSLRCRARSARRYKKFAQNVEQKLPVLEDYLSGLEKRIIAIIDKLDLSAVAA
jgi:hypothetical protein